MKIKDEQVLELEDVSFEFSSEKKVFSHVTLRIAKNDLFLLQGRSGSGKSTFLKLLNRFYQSNSGRITLHGKDVCEYPITEFRSRLLYLPQLPTMIPGSVGENLLFPFVLKVYENRQFDSEKAREWLDFFQLSVRLEDDAFTLSVGEKQRVALIRALLLEPEVLLLDEPTSALDRENRTLIENRIESLAEMGKATVVFVTHQESCFNPQKANSYKVLRKTLVPVEDE